MLSFLTHVYEKYFVNKEIKCLMLGSHDSGIETIISQIANFPFEYVFLGNRNSFPYRELDISYWYFEGEYRIIHLFKHYKNILGIIYIVDSSNIEQINKSRDAIRVLHEEEAFRDSVFLVLANKQDNPNAYNPKEITKMLKLNSISDRYWKLYGVSGKTESIIEAFNWIEEKINEKFYF
ncbi:hypothetical protein M9Y10_006387 [Tritrichomonas musculus]|uniref:ADP-ribosylation factor n=2 Tax=Tritrichomonas musculus TaxID=1915356 RepID=A0ABR2JF23_9EUKA